MKTTWRLFSCIRFKEVLVLQGAPIVGMILSTGTPSVSKIAMAALFCLANFFLVAHVWTLNDWADICLDKMDGNKSSELFTGKGVHPRTMFWFSIALLLASLGLFLVISSGTLLIAVSITILGFLYSFPGIYTKGIALLSSVTHLVGGLLYFILGYSLFAPVDTNAILIASFFALIFTAGHGIQEVQDHDADRLAGIRTNAVVFGKLWVFGIAVAGFIFAYAYLFFLAVADIVPGRLMPAALLLWPLHLHWAIQALRAGLSFQSVRRFRRGYNALFAVIGLGVISTLFS